MARRITKKSEQLGFDMGMILPKLVPMRERGVPIKEEISSREEIPVRPKPDLADSVKESPQTESKILSVAELTHRITHLLEEGIGLIWVEGEISNFRKQPSGHAYFTLKDESAQLSCVLFARTAAVQGKELLRDGRQVQLYGQISVYQVRGAYQLMVKLVQSKGEGVLQARFEELKRRLAAEGLFDQERKRELPRFPRRIGVVTSPTGAAIRDFLQVLHRRHPGLQVVISPARVQGKGAAAEIASAITELASGAQEIGPVDVIVVTRGGGSLEDLWEFNEEIVARAIAASCLPVVSAVGHEIDFSIADFVADFRAPTPSAAAELLAADSVELIERSRALVARIGREAEATLERHQAEEYRLSGSVIFREPLRRLDEARQTSDRLEEMLIGILERRMDHYTAHLTTASALLASAHPRQHLAQTHQLMTSLRTQLDVQVRHRLERESGRYAHLYSAFSALSPEATLKRGFSITRDSKGRVVTSAAQIAPGESIRTQFAVGEIHSEVQES